MSKFLRIALIIVFVQIMTWCICWGCLNPDIVKTSWFGLSKEFIAGNTALVFWICFLASIVGTAGIICTAINLWTHNIIDAVKKLEEEKKEENNKETDKDPVVPDMK